MFSQEVSFLVSNLYGKHRFHGDAEFLQEFDQKI
jgi:hypothetical protein